MARKPWSYAFQLELPYVDDRGIERPGVKGNFKVPPDLSDVQAGQIAAAIGGVSKGDPNFPGNVPCSEQGLFKPRKIRLVRNNGSSLSVIMPFRSTDLISSARQVRDILNLGEFKVVCIQLMGEETGDIRDELVAGQPLAGGATSGTATIPPAAVGKAPFYTQVMAYEADTDFAAPQTRYIPMKMRTDLVPAGVPAIPTDFTTVWNTTVGQPANVPKGCTGQGRKRTLRPRKFILTRQVTYNAEVLTEINEVPIAVNRADLQIQAGGAALASLPSTLCIKYKGEDNMLFHRVLA